MSVAVPEAPGRVVMYGMSWSAYGKLLDALEQQHVRVSFDRGRLEIMSPTGLHERLKRLLSLLVTAISSVFELPIHGFGSATFRREGLKRGVEADEWFYVANELAVRGKDEIDLDEDPPPDLAIEIDVTSTVDARLPIYWALGVVEIWVWRDETIRFLGREETGGYRDVECSVAFPFLRPSQVAEFLAQRHNVNEVAFAHEFASRLRTRNS